MIDELKAAFPGWIWGYACEYPLDTRILGWHAEQEVTVEISHHEQLPIYEATLDDGTTWNSFFIVAAVRHALGGGSEA